VIVALPFRDLPGGATALDLSACPYAGEDAGGVWISPSLSGESDGYSAGKAEDAPSGTGAVILRGGL